MRTVETGPVGLVHDGARVLRLLGNGSDGPLKDVALASNDVRMLGRWCDPTHIEVVRRQYSTRCKATFPPRTVAFPSTTHGEWLLVKDLTNAVQDNTSGFMRAFADDFSLAQATRVLLILALTACGGAPEPEVTEFSGTFSGTTTIVAPEEERSLDRCNANASDGEHPGFSLSGFDDLTGEFNVLGPVTIVASDCIHPERRRFAQGRAILTSVSGDALMTEFYGSFRATDNPDIEVGRGEHQIVGGTGQFAQAEGTVVCEFRTRVSSSEVRGRCDGDMSL